MRVRLQQLGAYKEGTVWRMPVGSIPTQSNPEITIDFRDKNEEVEDF